jgi:hypothetical protein
VFGAVVSAFPHNLAQGVRWDAIAAALLMLGIAALARAKVRPHARATAKN